MAFLIIASLFMRTSEMRKFILKVLLFFVVIAIVDCGFGLAMSNVLKGTQKGDWGRNNYIFNEVKSDVIILGSSRAIHHYDPQIISDSLSMSCYNCGEDGMGIFLMRVRYQAIRERFKPKIVIYEVLPEYDLLGDIDNSRYLKFLRPYCDKSIMRSVIDDVSATEGIKLYSEMYRYNSVFVDIIAQSVSKSTSTAKEYSYSPLWTQMNNNPGKETGLERSTTFDSVKIAYLEDIILQCERDGTLLFFTASPKYASFSDEEFKPLKDLCLVYHVPFINHYCDSNYCGNLTYFADASHLNIKGAESFTSMLASEVKGILNSYQK